MTDYTKLIEALRYCKVDYCSSCLGCPMYADYEGSGCLNEMHDDAADAIEALQAEIRESMQRCAECGDELAHQMPKRGEIVRCGECKHRNDLTPTKWHPCVDMAVNDDWFCADGERGKK